MIKLLIKNFAPIKDLEIDFQVIYCCFRRHWAGKSIMLESNILMERDQMRILFDKNTKCVELSLIIKNNKKNIFIENNIDFYSETIIRREIFNSGRSRAFINDTPVTLSVLNLITLNFRNLFSKSIFKFKNT